MKVIYIHIYIYIYQCKYRRNEEIHRNKTDIKTTPYLWVPPFVEGQKTIRISQTIALVLIPK